MSDRYVEATVGAAEREVAALLAEARHTLATVDPDSAEALQARAIVERLEPLFRDLALIDWDAARGRGLARTCWLYVGCQTEQTNDPPDCSEGSFRA